MRAAAAVEEVERLLERRSEVGPAQGVVPWVDAVQEPAERGVVAGQRRDPPSLPREADQRDAIPLQPREERLDLPLGLLETGAPEVGHQHRLAGVEGHDQVEALALHLAQRESTHGARDGEREQGEARDRQAQAQPRRAGDETTEEALEPTRRDHRTRLGVRQAQAADPQDGDRRDDQEPREVDRAEQLEAEQGEERHGVLLAQVKREA